MGVWVNLPDNVLSYSLTFRPSRLSHYRAHATIAHCLKEIMLVRLHRRCIELHLVDTGPRYPDSVLIRIVRTEL